MSKRSFASAHRRACKLGAGLFYVCVAGPAIATDADGDGIDASWESTYSGSPAFMSDSDATDAWEDPDGDLLNNLGEFLAGTNPGDADSDDDGLNDNFNYGLDSWWRFSESAGTPASSANAVSGRPSLTLNGASIASTGLFGNALKPTYYNQKVQTAAVVLDGATEWTFSGWFNLESTSSTNILFSSKYDASSTNQIGASINGTSWGSMTLYITLKGYDYGITINIAQFSNYHHLVVSRDQTANRAHVYFDGAFVSSVAPIDSPEPLGFSSGQFKVAVREVPGTSYHNWLYGKMDEVRLYSRRLAATEIDALYNHGCTSANAAKYWTIPYLLNNPLGQQDSDNDGYTNLAEVIAGSDPNNVNSTPVPASTGYQLHTKLG